MNTFLSLALSGLQFGAMYGLVAVGLTVLLRSANVPNFAQGAFGLLAAYVGWDLATHHHFSPAAATLAGIAAATALSYGSNRFGLSRIPTEHHLAVVIFTIGLTFAINGAVQVAFGTDLQQFPNPLPTTFMTVSSFTFSLTSVVTIVAGAVLAVSTSLFFRYARYGLAIRATASDPVSAEYLGVNAARMTSAAWIVAGILAGITGVLVTSQTYLGPSVMDDLLFPAFTAGALGGFASFEGVFAGGLILGLVQSFGAGYVTASFAQSLVFIVLLLVLVVRPQGIFGSREISRV